MAVKIGFICTGNSARSQMAEGFGKYYAEKLNKDVEVYSAGSNPSGYVHPLAIKVMAEKGIDISQNKSKSLDDIPLRELDYVITLCGDAAESCPVIPGANTQHWGLPDPARAEGSEEEKLEVFRQIRDKIEEKVKELIEKL
ncbi:arsenate reductase ArsC [Venenivibrio stagnispumantis]|uniref:Arsenate reductase n=1 Tax=Venenivibrio stagnispumantis TaxID=407998 RepID=A0AA45WPG2_9AQUI|nr:arsenate reductase ArsC [Venenivibrio stagnispumantis]MCW4572673.1 arsenate reductase ArsC [Venenivibrio stagnispumantis]SMP21505.1 arsenate reductase [Venenivibrio stagnispumantis]